MKSFPSLSIATLALTLPAFPQSEPPAPDAALDEMVVTASPQQRSLFEQIQQVNVLKGHQLLLNLQPTLGETLAKEPGVSSTYFGPGASRPIIRGLGDDRVRILQNGTSILDVSNVSPDHAVASDPLSISSVEVVRGPATLLYGPNTIGGVVNMIDDRIPTERFDGKWPSGNFGTAFGSADDSEAYSGALTFGKGPLVFHLDGFSRDTEDLAIPGFARSSRLRASSPLAPGEHEAYGILPNSATESQGAGLGGSYVWDKGYFGLSYSGVDSLYGTVAEPDVTIDLRQRRWDLRGAFYEPTGWLKEVEYKFGYTDYAHTEFEGAEPGTEFLIEGYNGRIDLQHQKAGPFEGSFGFETRHDDFSALGEEAFLPSVENDVNSLFVFEEVPFDKLRLQFGARYDHQSNQTDANPLFGPGMERDFDAFSTSAGLIYNPAPDYAVALSLAYTQRPPTYVELFANGPHVATGTAELGDPFLDTENSVSIDLSLKKKAGRITGSAGLFYYRFDDFISLAPTGNNLTLPDGDIFPIYAYEPVGADFRGGEIEATFHLLDPVEADAKPADRRLDLTLRADYTRADNRDSDEPLPRIPPFRTLAALEYESGGWSARLEGQYAAHQDRHDANELPTDSYFLLNAALGYTLDLGDTRTTFYLKGNNLTNEEARSSTSILKDIAPLAGRGVIAGVRTEF
ncbi:TonB-dependent receptor [Haloferula sp. BvORR071]|uniref:TonB-dependent receptor n=1 Tax=Haloferula sp. BvORR071 TaxID=1396141 RepID=UPI0005550EF7|nr:TonB-dependent receptor [Haloferula sp. BvORR071]